MKNIGIEISYQSWLLQPLTMNDMNEAHGYLHSLVVEKDLTTKTCTAYGKYKDIKQILHKKSDDSMEYVNIPVEVPKDLSGAINEKNLLAMEHVEEVDQLDGGTYHVDICIDGVVTHYDWNDSEMETQRLLKLLSRWYDKFL